MNYGELKAALSGLINRKDVTDALAAQFITQAQDRLERWPQMDPLKVAPRPKFTEKLVTFTLGEDNDGTFNLPTDFLELIDLYSANGEMERVDMRGYLKESTEQGTPAKFIQTGSTIRMRPLPAADEALYLNYYAAQPKLQYAADKNGWSVSCTEALLYSAAEFAADHFEDERLLRFEAKARTALSELQDQTLSEDFSGPMSISPAYTYAD
jgi:hypothetical protein